MASNIGIQVAIRCRPFAMDDKLGVKLYQTNEEEGEVELINCDYTTLRFPFTYAWWSAYGYKRHLKGDNMGDADSMTLIDQQTVYQTAGQKIKSDLLAGNAVVMFAYGLSGSGKTYTVFGPDSNETPDAWFKHSTPHQHWGIFPRLAYEILQEKQDGWKISLKYFQNVVDTVRDLMSPNAEEQHYKNGMRKDGDGFMDIEWCSSKVVTSWTDLCEQYKKAVMRKAIAPTQFNPTSTRGHCIMVFEVEKPHPEMEGVKQRGRIYVCDLAGTEPAGDIVHALYTKLTMEDGYVEYRYDGPHADMKKTKELQEQGKKINLSLSEMAQFFMKMAEAAKKKKLAPGVSIPGCNNFFLCKYLKDTMLQAKTYLFCAIRPEIEYIRYTFSTLGFAKNASIVRLNPKKAMTFFASEAEKKLMAELEAMKSLVAQLTNQNTQALSQQAHNSYNNEEAERLVADLQRKLAEKQDDLQRQLMNTNQNSQESQLLAATEEKERRQRAEYARKGISLFAYEGVENTHPYFLNVEEDAFRSNRFMYIINKPRVVFGIKGDVQLMSLSVLREHCFVEYTPGTSEGEEDGIVKLVRGKGEIFVNGQALFTEGEAVVLQIFDRVVIGDQLMIFRWPGREERECVSQGLLAMEAEDAVSEYQEGLLRYRQEMEARLRTAETQPADENNNALESPNKVAQQLAAELDEERRRIREEREKWEKEKSQRQTHRDEEQYQRGMSLVDNMILDLLPKVKEAKQTVDLMNRVTMTFDVVLEKGSNNNSSSSSNNPLTLSEDPSVGGLDEGGNVPKVKIHVENSVPKYSILLEPAAFLSKLSLLKDEMMRLRGAIEGGEEYTVPERHDPLYLMFDTDFLLGSSTHWPEYLIYNLETDPEEQFQDIKNAAVPYNTVGLLNVKWTPLSSPIEDEEPSPSPSSPSPSSPPIPPPEIESEDDLLSRPWSYLLEISQATDLPVFCEVAYFSYEFFGETCTSEAVQQTTFSPRFDYRKIHHIPSVGKDFIEFLKRPFEVQINVTQHVYPPVDLIGTSNFIVSSSILSGEAHGYSHLSHTGGLGSGMAAAGGRGGTGVGGVGVGGGGTMGGSGLGTGGGGDAESTVVALEDRCRELYSELTQSREENSLLRNRILDLELKLSEHNIPFQPHEVKIGGGGPPSLANTRTASSSNLSHPLSRPKSRQNLKDAKIIDQIVNNS